MSGPPRARVLLAALLVPLAAAASAASGGASTDEPFDAPLAVVRVEAVVRPDLERNAVEVEAATTLRNTSGSPVVSARFALGNPGEARGMSVVLRAATVVRGSRREPAAMTTEPAGPGSRREVHVLSLAEPIAAGGELVVRWAYVLQGEPGRATPPSPTSPDGSHEVYLVQDFEWLPSPFVRAQPGVLPHLAQPDWRLRVEIPAGHHVVVDGRRRGRSERDGLVVEEWASIVPGWPQLLAGRCEVLRTAGQGLEIEWCLPHDAGLRQAAEALAPKALAALRQLVALYGDPGSGSYRVVVARAPFGAHALFMGQVIEAACLHDLDLATLAHEMAHTWWGQSVASYHAGSKLLRESLAELSAGRVLREIEGEAAYREQRRKWKIRAFCPYPAANDRPGAGARVETPSADAAESRIACCSKGPLVLEAIRAELGDARFDAAVRRLAEDRRGRGATVSHLLAVLGDDERSAAWRTWLFERGHPGYAVDSFSSAVRDATSVSVTVANRGTLAVPVPLLLRWRGGERRETVSVAAGERRSYRFAVPARVRVATVDPDLDAFTYTPEQAVPLWLSLDPAGFGGTNWSWFNASWARFRAGRSREAAELLGSYLTRSMQRKGLDGLDALGRDPLEACYLVWQARYRVALRDELRAGAELAAAVPGLAGLLRDPALLRAPRAAGLVDDRDGHAQLLAWLADLTGRPLALAESADAATRRSAVDEWIAWWDREGRTRPIAVEALEKRLPAPGRRRTGRGRR